jgi:hypothetical protein
MMLRNLTVNAEAAVIRRARRRAKAEHMSLNGLVRGWLEQYAGCETAASDYERLMAKMDHVAPGGKFTRDELNER